MIFKWTKSGKRLLSVSFKNDKKLMEWNKHKKKWKIYWVDWKIIIWYKWAIEDKHSTHKKADYQEMSDFVQLHSNECKSELSQLLEIWRTKKDKIIESQFINNTIIEHIYEKLQKTI